MGIIKDPTSWRTGFELGLAGFSFPYSKPRKPTAYLYNGIRMPALPEWDREKYPYAVIRHHMTGKRLLCAKKPIVEVLTDDGEGTGFVWIPGDCIYATCRTNSDSWTDFYTDSDVSLTVNRPFWTNTDIYLNDGTIYLAASDPVPVYE